MAEHIFLKKRQRRRTGNLLTAKNAVRLIVVSLATLGGFLYFIGDPTTSLCEAGCESRHSLAAWTLGFFMIFAFIIAAAAVIGVLFSFIRWQRGSNETSFFALMEKDTPTKPD